VAALTDHRAGSASLVVAYALLFAGLAAATTGAAVGYAIDGSPGAQMLACVAGVLTPTMLIVLELTHRSP
jgi:hypothetical protein